MTFKSPLAAAPEQRAGLEALSASSNRAEADRARFVADARLKPSATTRRLLRPPAIGTNLDDRPLMEERT